MSVFKKYPSIGKFADVLKAVNKNNKRIFSHLDVAEDGTKTPVFNSPELPQLTFRGTVKLHGTNSAVVINSDLTVDAQSRNRLLALGSDNHGFCTWLMSKTSVFLDEYKTYMENLDVYSLHIYGEWCGSNIQSNVALTGIEKTFVIFGILQTNLDDSEVWLSHEDINYLTSKEDNIYSIYDFPTYEVTIDMNNPADGLSEANKLRDQIDAVCPVAKALGSEVECTHGEGLVFRCITEGYQGLAFKHKGESHQRSGKSPKKQSIKEPLTEKQQLMFDNFLTEACTVDRLAQGVEFLQEQGLDLSRKNTGVYLKWFSEDVQKECKTSLINLVTEGITWSCIIKPLSQMAREFLFSEIDKV